LDELQQYSRAPQLGAVPASLASLLRDFLRQKLDPAASQNTLKWHSAADPFVAVVRLSVLK
jgi:hypothetical protein